MKISCLCGCGTEFEEKNKHGDKRQFVFGHVSRLRIGENNPMFGKKPHNYKGVTVNKFGYIQVFSPNHPHRDNHNYVMEHRLVMEQHLGRYLDPKEVVHHIDHNPKNNKIENLMLFPNHAEHIQYEMKKDMSNRNCLICGGKTYVSKDGREQWYKYKEGFRCRKCHVNDISDIAS